MLVGSLLSIFLLVIYATILGLGVYIALLVIKALQIYIRNHS